MPPTTDATGSPAAPPVPPAPGADEAPRQWVRPAGARPRLFSGMQPSGELHLGNLKGALENWIRLANDGGYDCFFSIVDYHALTIEQSPDELRRRVFDVAVDWLAAGLDPGRATIFVQSDVPEHTELAWIFNTLAYLGRLENMTQYKDKSAQHPENLNAGLLTYPVLQAADILLYKGEAVPVGEDQAQHLELSREIARRFNFRFGPVFPEPKTLHTPARRILGLDGQAKMSKSLGNHVALRDSAAVVTEKLTRRAASDTNRKRRSDPGNPDICYVYSLHRHFSPPDDQAMIDTECRRAGIGCFDCKKRLADRVNAELEPIRERAAGLVADPAGVFAILDQGARKARIVATETTREVRDAVGLTRRAPGPAA